MASETERDAEIAALEATITALRPLDDEARARVLEYTLRRLGMHELPATALASTPVASELPDSPVSRAPALVGVVDIRTLREQKNPGSANEMAALVAYYLAELAPESERKETVTAADVERLFKQANYRLPSRIAMALPNAAAAGYFDKAGSGGWKLNPVGHNLVTQTLPRPGGRSPGRPKRKPATTAKKRGASTSRSTSKAPPAKRQAASSKPKRSR